MLRSAILLRFKANYLEKKYVTGHPSFSMWIPLALAKIYIFQVDPTLATEVSRHCL